MKKFINFLKGFSLIEIMVTIIAIGVVTAASAPVITKRVQSHKTLINTTKIEVTPNCYDKYKLGHPPYLLSQICYPEESLVCKNLQGCPGDHAKDNVKCKCRSCSGAEPNGLGMTNCIECTFSPKKCKKCTPGYYLDGNICKKCPPGHYCIDGIQKKECESGSYGAGEAVRTECTLCEAGKAQNKTGQTACYSCNAGKYAPKKRGSEECETCRAGQYSPASGNQTACSDCNTGKYSSTDGASSCSECDKGRYSPVTGKIAECPPCNPGTANNIKGQTYCPTCTGGKYTAVDAYGKYNCDNCGKGYACSGGTSRIECISANGKYAPTANEFQCSTCPVGQYATDDNGNYGPTYLGTKCKECDPGYACVGGKKNPCGAKQCSLGGKVSACLACNTSCLNGKCNLKTCKCDGCPPGYYPDSTGIKCDKCPEGCDACSSASVCTSCKAGYYKSGNKCLKCTAGYYCPGTNKQEPCTAGHECPKGSSKETACKSGKYSKDKAASCSNCSANQVPNATASGCDNCANRKYSNPGDATCSDCANGSYGLGAGMGCATCDKNAGKYHPTVGKKGCFTCPDGYYASSSTGCTKCQKGNYCTDGTKKPCQKGKYVNTKGATACIKCQSGKYNPHTGQTACPYDCSDAVKRATKCNRSTGACSDCKDGYTCSDDKTKCEKDPCTAPNCKTCYPGRPKSCKVCKSGFQPFANMGGSCSTLTDCSNQYLEVKRECVQEQDWNSSYYQTGKDCQMEYRYPCCSPAKTDKSAYFCSN